MSANLVVDLGNTTDFRASVMQGSGASFTVGEIVDLIDANSFCNVFCAGGAGSGAVELRIQTSDSLTSGSFTDPTSGLVAGQFPPFVASGGIFFANSGIPGSGNIGNFAPVGSAPLFCSGGIQFAAFQRPGRYARLINNSGVFPSWMTAGFISQRKQTGSGAGWSWAPQSGSTINV